MAEGAGFEPAIGLPLYTLSRRAPSTARPPLRTATLSTRCGGGRDVAKPEAACNATARPPARSAACSLCWRDATYARKL